jgi:hypothetical protein
VTSSFQGGHPARVQPPDQASSGCDQLQRGQHRLALASAAGGGTGVRPSNVWEFAVEGSGPTGGRPGQVVQKQNTSVVAGS